MAQADLVKRAPSDEPYFVGQGSSDDIPAFLRTPKRGERVRNRRTPKVPPSPHSGLAASAA